MGGRLFGSGKSRLSGAQPTFAAQGKAKGSKKGTKRAKAGGRVRSVDAFPEAGGRALYSGSEVEEELSSKGRAASSSTASRARSRAATKRACFSRTQPKNQLFLDDSDAEVLDYATDISSVSEHESDEPDSDQPDRPMGGKERRWLAKVKASKRKASGKAGGAVVGSLGGEEDEAAKIRRLRLEAMEKRGLGQQEKKKPMEIVLDSDGEAVAPPPSRPATGVSGDAGDFLSDQDDDDETTVPLWRPSQHTTLAELKQRQAKEKRSARAKAAVAARGEGPLPGTSGKNGKKAQKGRRLDEDDKVVADAAAEEGVGGRKAGKRRRVSPSSDEEDEEATSKERKKCKTKAKSKKRLLPPSSDADTCSDLEDLLASPPSAAKPTKRRKIARVPAPSLPSAATRTARAARRARTSGPSLIDSEEELEGDEGEAVVIDTGTGSSATRLPKKGKGTGKARAQPSSLSDSSDDDDADNLEEAEEEPDYSHLDIPALVDPRDSLRRRKLRDLSDPPTDAFSSSDGEADNDEGTPEGAEADLEAWGKIEKKMVWRKKQFEEDRGAGYSNPRRN
ncbi:hypothetical protein JCM11641_001165 [Rhodosporidiobolus odoratus]